MAYLVTGSQGGIGAWMLKTLFQRALGPLPRTPLRDGVRQTIGLLRAGRLDTHELS